jgi:hypothetical protein
MVIARRLAAERPVLSDQELHLFLHQASDLACG